MQEGRHVPHRAVLSGWSVELLNHSWQPGVMFSVIFPLQAGPHGSGTDLLQSAHKMDEKRVSQKTLHPGRLPSAVFVHGALLCPPGSCSTNGLVILPSRSADTGVAGALPALSLCCCCVFVVDPISPASELISALLHRGPCSG